MVKRITGGNVFDVTVSQNIRKNWKSSNKEFPILLGCVVYHTVCPTLFAGIFKKSWTCS